MHNYSIEMFLARIIENIAMFRHISLRFQCSKALVLHVSGLTYYAWNEKMSFSFPGINDPYYPI